MQRPRKRQFACLWMAWPSTYLVHTSTLAHSVRWLSGLLLIVSRLATICLAASCSAAGTNVVGCMAWQQLRGLPPCCCSPCLRHRPLRVVCSIADRCSPAGGSHILGSCAAPPTAWPPGRLATECCVPGSLAVGPLAGFRLGVDSSRVVGSSADGWPQGPWTPGNGRRLTRLQDTCHRRPCTELASELDNDWCANPQTIFRSFHAPYPSKIPKIEYIYIYRKFTIIYIILRISSFNKILIVFFQTKYI
jgi:hypothetical protein